MMFQRFLVYPLLIVNGFFLFMGALSTFAYFAEVLTLLLLLNPFTLPFLLAMSGDSPGGHPLLNFINFFVLPLILVSIMFIAHLAFVYFQYKFFKSLRQKEYQPYYLLIVTALLPLIFSFAETQEEAEEISGSDAYVSFLENPFPDLAIMLTFAPAVVVFGLLQFAYIRWVRNTQFSKHSKATVS